METRVDNGALGVLASTTSALSNLPWGRLGSRHRGGVRIGGPRPRAWRCRRAAQRYQEPMPVQ